MAAVVLEARILELAEDHALMDELSERLGRADDAGVVKHLVPEAGVQEM